MGGYLPPPTSPSPSSRAHFLSFSFFHCFSLFFSFFLSLFLGVEWGGARGGVTPILPPPKPKLIGGILGTRGKTAQDGALTRVFELTLTKRSAVTRETRAGAVHCAYVSLE